MGWFDRIDRKNQETLERHNARDPVVEPGVQTVASVRPLLTISAIGLGAFVVAVVAQDVWSRLAGVGVFVLCAVLSWSMARDVRDDVRAWRRRRRLAELVALLAMLFVVSVTVRFVVSGVGQRDWPMVVVATIVGPLLVGTAAAAWQASRRSTGGA